MAILPEDLFESPQNGPAEAYNSAVEQLARANATLRRMRELAYAGAAAVRNIGVEYGLEERFKEIGRLAYFK